MDWQDRLSRWYQTHFPLESSEVTFEALTKHIFDAMEDSRSEGIDGKTYVANKYVVEIAEPDDKERDYLLSYIDEQILSAILEKSIAAKGYNTRGPLDFTIEEIEAFPGGSKLYVRALFDKNVVARRESVNLDVVNPAIPAVIDDRQNAAEEGSVAAPIVDSMDQDEFIDHPDADEEAWAALLVEMADGRRSLMSINKPIFTIGRSRHGSNDLVLAEDGLVSKRHIRIELEPDGTTTLYDLASTNGTFVNGNLVPVNISLTSGDVIEIGQTHIQFQRDFPNANKTETTEEVKPITAPIPVVVPHEDSIPEVRQTTILPTDPESLAGKTAKIKRVSDGIEHAIGEEVVIGRGLTCNIVIAEPTVSTQQARLQASEGRYVIQDLSGRGTTIVNSRPARVGERIPLSGGDRLSLGGIAFTFDLV